MSVKNKDNIFAPPAAIGVSIGVVLCVILNFATTLDGLFGSQASCNFEFDSFCERQVCVEEFFARVGRPKRSTVRLPDPQVPTGQNIMFEDVADSLLCKGMQSAQTGGTVAIGNSIMKSWVGIQDDLSLTVLNNGISGSRTWELLAYADKLVTTFRPKTVIVYGGSNDIDFREQANQIAGRTEAFMKYLSTALPDVEIIYISINKSPQK